MLLPDPYSYLQHNKLNMPPPFPGCWTLANHPYLIEILKAIFQNESVALLKSAQSGGTSLFLAAIVYILAVRHQSCGLLEPSEKSVERLGQVYLSTLIAHTPFLKNLFTVDTKLLKSVGDATLALFGAKSIINLSSIPLPWLFVDEVDLCGEAAIQHALTRGLGQKEFHVFYTGTPTEPDIGIHKRFLEGSQEFYFFRCPGCHKFITMLFPESIEICGENKNDINCNRSYFKCPTCGKKLDHETKKIWLKNRDKADPVGTGVWVPCQQSSTRSFSVNGLMSPVLDAPRIVKAYFEGLE